MENWFKDVIEGTSRKDWIKEDREGKGGVSKDAKDEFSEDGEDKTFTEIKKDGDIRKDEIVRTVETDQGLLVHNCNSIRLKVNMEMLLFV